ncbi:uncharacterized protein BDV14DRAFT_58133 [Aspergillus stella-maris]|uniref:uncharacterized protein n=1 Tax=Aspergillus stella-maris TaxID=1810926 RepID=UPI003CCE37CC
MGRLYDAVPNANSDVESNYDQPQRLSWTRIVFWCLLGYSCMLGIFVRVFFPELSLLKLGLPLFVHGSNPALFYAFSQSPRRFIKPNSLEIVALVPFHQYSATEILDCYLQRNLASNGGFLDRVVFLPQTTQAWDLEWLEATVSETSSYSFSNTSHAHIVTTDALFVWIDGDVVFLEDQTIPTMVKTKLDNPDSLVVSANVINEAALEGLHNHPSIALPYLPELQRQPSEYIDHDDWKASALPRWQGRTGFRVPRDFPPPFGNHRWLLSGEEGFDHTPIGMSIYSEDGPRPGEWTIKAQQHYSFLHHLESGHLNRYKFPLWRNPTDPISTAFFCLEGGNAEFVESFTQIDREGSNDLLARSSAKKQDKEILIDGKGLAVRYASGPDSKGLDATDVLQRYRSYAREMVCPDYI